MNDMQFYFEQYYQFQNIYIEIQIIQVYMYDSLFVIFVFIYNVTAGRNGPTH